MEHFESIELDIVDGPQQRDHISTLKLAVWRVVAGEEDIIAVNDQSGKANNAEGVQNEGEVRRHTDVEVAQAGEPGKGSCEKVARGGHAEYTDALQSIQSDMSSSSA